MDNHQQLSSAERLQIPQSAPPTTSALAVVSLVFSLLALGANFLLPFVSSIVAVVTGHMARANIRNSNGAVTGDGLAVAGLVIGYIGLGFAALFFLIIAGILAS